MSSAAQIIAECTSRRIWLTASTKENLEIDAPEDALTENLLSELRNRKSEIQWLLNSQGFADGPRDTHESAAFPRQKEEGSSGVVDRKDTRRNHASELHEITASRIIPLFPEIAEQLQDAWDAAKPGEEVVLPMLDGISGAGLRKPLIAAIRACGEEPWEKLWTALRATRDTELRETYPVHVVEKWMGHEDRVAKRNYTQVTEEHFRKAVSRGADCGSAGACGNLRRLARKAK